MGATRLLTFRQFERLPDRPGKDELLRGELLELPPTVLQHHRIVDRIWRRLESAVAEAHARGEAKAIGEVCHEFGYHLSAQSFVQPDLSVTHSDQAEAKYFLGAPAIAVEVLSPSNTPAKLELKGSSTLRPVFSNCGTSIRRNAS